MNKVRIMRQIGLWPPYLGTGISIRHMSEDFTRIEVVMKLRWYNRNYVGTHFGGSLYAMTDPFYMLMLIENLGPDYIVWDKAAEIRFKRPGRGTVSAIFTISREQIDEIRRQAEIQQKVEPEFTVEIMDDSKNVVAEVKKLLYVRRKKTQTKQNPRLSSFSRLK